MDLQAANRWEAIDELIGKLVAEGKIKVEHREPIAAAVKKREASMSTGIGYGIGIPHASTDLISEVVIELGHSKKGIDFDALDKQPVFLVMLFLVPQGQFQKHLHTLANIAKILHNAEFRQALQQASDGEELLRIITGLDKAGIGKEAKTPMLPHKQIELELQRAVLSVLPDADVSKVLVRPTANPKFGDYQSNALISLAKQRKLNPDALLKTIGDKTGVYLRLLNGVCETVESAGPGFLNFKLKSSALVEVLQSAARGEHLFFSKSEQPHTVVVDFSSPNVAKPMHVGHIRSTGIGDALQRLLRLLGHRVITDNHIGDWGTQFGMLIFGWKREDSQNQSKFRSALNADPLGEMERLYKRIVIECESNPDVLNSCREELVKLQQHGFGPENRNIWRIMVDWSKNQFEKIYGRLGVKFDHALGESFYNPQLEGVVADLLTRGVARESEGAVGVFSDGSVPPKEDPFLVNRDGEWVADPALIRKSDGGFNYTTTDLATIDYRLKTWSPDEIVYVVDDRQSGHFKKLFAAFTRWQPEAAKKVKLIHVGFGKILGEDGKPFKTRSGDTVKLGELLDEAEARAFNIVSDKSPDLPEPQRREIARVIGIGAVKYADLLPNRQSDYMFSWDKMLALSGNTAPYLQYAYARIRSIFRKAGDNSELGTRNSELILAAPQEFALAKHLLNFGLVLEAAADEYRPNFICNYLYELAGKFTSFYENCPVLKAEPAERASRLVLCDLTARTLKQGLDVLGIETLEQM